MNFQYFTPAIIFSFLLHLCIILLMAIKHPAPSSQMSEKIREKYIPLRTVGVRKGQKLFNQKIPLGNSEMQQTGTAKISKANKASSSIPTPNTGPTSTKLSAKKKRLTTNSSKILRNIKVTPQEIEQLQKIKYSTLNKYGPAIRNLPIMRKSGFYFKFVPTKGIPEDELNSIEKIFYSFQKRTYQSYVSSLLSNYNELLTSRPYIEKTLFTKKQVLTGRMVIDDQGNILRIKFIQTSDNDNLQKLFENTLTDINTIPNPPKQLLRDSNELNIYFQLIISD